MAKRKANELVTLPKTGPKDPLKVPFETVVAWVFRSGTKVEIGAQGEMHVDIGEGAPSWLRDVLEVNRERLYTRARCQALDAYIEKNKRRLQMGASPELIVKGVPWLLAKCDELEKLSGTPGGYIDPSNIFAIDCLDGYRDTLKNLLAG